MDKKFKECSEKLRKLVSDIQGAPYPGNLDDELYYIWYEIISINHFIIIIQNSFFIFFFIF